MKHFFLFFFSLLSFVSFVSLPVSVFADEPTTGDSVSINIDFRTTSSTGSETVSNYLWGEFVAEWLGEDENTLTVYDVAARLADTYISYQFGVPSGGVSLVKDAAFAALRNYAFSVNSQTGIVTAPKEFYNDLKDIYERLGFDEVDQLIGYWHALPFESGNTRVYSSQTVYYTKVNVTGGGGQRILYAFRGSSATVSTQYIASGATSNYNLNQNYIGTDFSGVWRQGTSAGFDNAISGYFSDNDWATYNDNTSITSAQERALADFFGDTEPSGGTVWNGRLYFDDTPNSFTLNNVKSGTDAAVNRYVVMDINGVTPDDDIESYFNGDTTIIYYPNFSDIPNTHDFSFELPSGTIPDLDFDFNYTIQEDTGGSFFAAFDGVFNSSGGILVICVVIMGVFLLIEVMT